jgi:hypothetical protein
MLIALNKTTGCTGSEELSERNGCDPVVTDMSKNVTTRWVLINPGWVSPNWQGAWWCKVQVPVHYAPRHEGVLGNACVECWVGAFYTFSILIFLDKGKCTDKVPFPLGARSNTWTGGRSLPGISGALPFESIFFSVMSVVSCQVEVTASGWSPTQRNHTNCGVYECDREAPTVRRLRPTRGFWTEGGNAKINSP